MIMTGLASECASLDSDTADGRREEGRHVELRTPFPASPFTPLPLFPPPSSTWEEGGGEGVSIPIHPQRCHVYHRRILRGG